MNRKYPIPNERKYRENDGNDYIGRYSQLSHYETHYPPSDPSDNSLMDVQTVALCPKYYGYYGRSKISF